LQQPHLLKVCLAFTQGTQGIPPTKGLYNEGLLDLHFENTRIWKKHPL